MVASVCSWCRGPLNPKRPHARFCKQKCRQTAFRLRRRRALHERTDVPMRFAYCDPPYPGKAWMYRDQPTYGGEVNFPALVASLEASKYDGWALSTSERSLRWLLPLCPPEARVCVWVKPQGVPPASYGLHNTWEPLIVVGGRQLPPGVRDFLAAKPARGGGDLPGRKPLAFCAWLFDCLGMQPGDELDDLFPGTGIVGRTWGELSRVGEALGDGSLLEQRPDRFLPRLTAPSDGTRRAAAGDGTRSPAPDDATRSSSPDDAVASTSTTLR